MGKDSKPVRELLDAVYELTGNHYSADQVNRIRTRRAETPLLAPPPSETGFPRATAVMHWSGILARHTEWGERKRDKRLLPLYVAVFDGVPMIPSYVWLNVHSYLRESGPTHRTRESVEAWIERSVESNRDVYTRTRHDKPNVNPDSRLITAIAKERGDPDGVGRLGVLADARDGLDDSLRDNLWQMWDPDPSSTYNWRSSDDPRDDEVYSDGMTATAVAHSYPEMWQRIAGAEMDRVAVGRAIRYMIPNRWEFLDFVESTLSNDRNLVTLRIPGDGEQSPVYLPYATLVGLTREFALLNHTVALSSQRNLTIDEGLIDPLLNAYSVLEYPERWTSDNSIYLDPTRPPGQVPTRRSETDRHEALSE